MPSSLSSAPTERHILPSLARLGLSVDAGYQKLAAVTALLSSAVGDNKNDDNFIRFSIPEHDNSFGERRFSAMLCHSEFRPWKRTSMFPR